MLMMMCALTALTLKEMRMITKTRTAPCAHRGRWAHAEPELRSAPQPQQQANATGQAVMLMMMCALTALTLKEMKMTRAPCAHRDQWAHAEPELRSAPQPKQQANVTGQAVMLLMMMMMKAKR